MRKKVQVTGPNGTFEGEVVVDLKTFTVTGTADRLGVLYRSFSEKSTLEQMKEHITYIEGRLRAALTEMANGQEVLSPAQKLLKDMGFE